jgi:hypothetical protein
MIFGLAKNIQTKEKELPVLDDSEIESGCPGWKEPR